MSTAPNGGPAFPWSGLGDDGMSLRDYFAAHAPEPPQAWRGGDRAVSDCIAWRYYYADAMLRERAK